jgi:hypothetical protein
VRAVPSSSNSSEASEEYSEVYVSVAERYFQSNSALSFTAKCCCCCWFRFVICLRVVTGFVEDEEVAVEEARDIEAELEEEKGCWCCCRD